VRVPAATEQRVLHACLANQLDAAVPCAHLRRGG
jgi:hypothetical protein